ncbi:MAG: hypothetical protein KDF24_10265 [Rhodocyclaceae bacterium]|nr:hypothetical protein [Rhodocyclaceae bacterium]MCB1963533.1 hypothetical protein [Rhodocyclaceae bacterium]
MRAASPHLAAPPPPLHRNATPMWDSMWILLLEMGVALALLIIIVWSTWPRKKHDENDQENG